MLVGCLSCRHRDPSHSLGLRSNSNPDNLPTLASYNLSLLNSHPDTNPMSDIGMAIPFEGRSRQQNPTHNLSETTEGSTTQIWWLGWKISIQIGHRLCGLEFGIWFGSRYVQESYSSRGPSLVCKWVLGCAIHILYGMSEPCLAGELTRTIGLWVVCTHNMSTATSLITRYLTAQTIKSLLLVLQDDLGNWSFERWSRKPVIREMIWVTSHPRAH